MCLHIAQVCSGLHHKFCNDVARPLQQLGRLRDRVAFGRQGRSNHPLDGGRAVGQQDSLVVGAVAHLIDVLRPRRDQQLTGLGLQFLRGGEGSVSKANKRQVLRIKDASPDYDGAVNGPLHHAHHGIGLQQVLDFGLLDSLRQLVHCHSNVKARLLSQPRK